MNAVEQLKSVLCDPDGKCCIAGSDEDRAIVDRALLALAAPVQEPEQEPVTVAIEHCLSARNERTPCPHTVSTPAAVMADLKWAVSELEELDDATVQFVLDVLRKHLVAGSFTPAQPAPAQQEPVAWLIPGSITTDFELAKANGDKAVPLGEISKQQWNPKDHYEDGWRDALESVKRATPPAEQTAIKQEWISVDERMPKPGAYVLAVFRYPRGKQRVIRAMHAPRHTLSEDDWGEFLHDGGDYDEATDTAYWPEGWYECNENEETHWQVHEEVTHWMPLPDAPAAHGIK